MGLTIDAAQLCACLGVPSLVAPWEADSQCAAMARDGLVDGEPVLPVVLFNRIEIDLIVVLTEDSDLLAFGTPYIARWEGEAFLQAFFSIPQVRNYTQI